MCRVAPAAVRPAHGAAPLTIEAARQVYVASVRGTRAEAQRHLEAARANGHLPVLLQARDERGHTLVEACVLRGAVDNARLLLELGAVPNRRVPHSLDTLLHLAARTGCRGVFRQVQQFPGASATEHTNRAGLTPLQLLEHTAAQLRDAHARR